MKNSENETKQSLDTLGRPIHNFKTDSHDNSDDITTSVVDVAEGGLAGIGDLLNGLYADSKYAIIREYVTNALDAHRESNTTEPVRVYGGTKEPFRKYNGKTIPNKTYYVVRDYGSGMTLEELTDTLGKYGGSTKTKKRKMVGKFGVGAKSALSVTDYFEVISVKNGMKTVATMEYHAQSGVSKVHVKEHVKTDERSGTTVKIPVPQMFFSRTYTTSLLDRLEQLTWALPAGSVLFNDEILPNNGKLLNSDNYIPIVSVSGEPLAWVKMNTKTAHPERDTWSYGRNVDNQNILVGGVPYRYILSKTTSTTRTIENLKKNGHEVILNFDAKSLALTPSREGIKTTDENETIILNSYEEVVRQIPIVFNEKLNSVSPEEAYKFRGLNAYPLNFSLKLFSNAYANKPTDSYLPEYYYRGEKMLNIWDVLEDYKKEEIETNVSSYVINLINFPANKDLSEANYHRKTLYRHAKLENIIVYGEYKGKAKNPITAYGKNALAQLGHKADYFEYFWFKTETEIPEQYRNIGHVIHINELQRLSKLWREANYAKPERVAKPKHKTVENSYYPVLDVDSTGKTTVELWWRDDVKNATGKVYYLDEASFHRNEHFWNRYIDQTGWDEERKKFANTTATTTIPSVWGKFSIAPHMLNGKLALIPKNKSLNAFLSANKTVGVLTPVSMFAKEIWNGLTRQKKIEVAVYLLMEDSDTYFYLRNKKSITELTNQTLLTVVDAIQGNNNELAELARFIKYFYSQTSQNDISNDGIPLFQRYWNQLKHPDPAVLDAVANISELA